MEYIGLDVHKQYTVACCLNSDSGEATHYTLNNTRAEFERLFNNPGEQKAVLEASGSSYTIYDMIEDLVDDIEMANPSQVKAIANAAVKTDKIDSFTLARLLSADLIPRCHVRPKPNRDAIYQLRHRLFLVRIRTRVKNRIPALIERQVEKIRMSRPQRSDQFGKMGRRWLDQLQLPEPDAKILRSMLQLLNSLDELITASEGWIKELFRSDRVAQRLATIPGIGAFLSVMIRFEIDDIKRFRDLSKLMCYAGLAPTTFSSGGKSRHGRQIKSCNHWLRWGLVEAVWPAITADIRLRNLYTKMKTRKHWNIATSVVAKKILTFIYKVWTEERNYLPVPPLDGVAKVGQP